ncbi:acetylcholine receptor subunit beta-like 1 isoform X1 [Drosophila elegans]|uniref:acetylcholine receptor subunit beta-like 1 isoform X1 n=1 Tax=Drosophila elegans TaxID=30023 RepID=UPI001BC86051|nr:acetylcholine receptor subunit beta-like 1 isoform X1 [Drosophila elegans]
MNNKKNLNKEYNNFAHPFVSLFLCIFFHYFCLWKPYVLLCAHHYALIKPYIPSSQFPNVCVPASVSWVRFRFRFCIRFPLCFLVSASEDEERLVRDLFRGYNKLIRPVQNMTQKVGVRFGLAFVQLINVNEKNQIMKSNVWLRLVWYDYQLQWDEADYGGIGVLRLPPDKVWKPDIVLFNNADGNYEVRYKSNVLIYPTGEVLWVPPAIYQSSCTIDVTYFPFDQQTCIMKFGSWTFNGDQVSLALYNNKNFVDLSDYWKSGTWDIIEVPAYLNVYEGDSNHPTETDITFYIIIRRKTLFYTVNLILPTVLISFLCVLVFYLPAEAGEKVTLGISILLSLVVFLLLVSKILPPTSLVLPLIAKYLLFTFIMNTVSILVTVIIINWNFRGPRTHRMPMYIRSIFLHYLPAFLFMKRPRKTRLRWMMEMPGMSMPAHPHPSYGSPAELPKHISAIGGKQSKMEVMELSDLHHPNCKINRKVNSGGELGLGDGCRRESESSDSILLSPEASKATEAVEFIAEHLRNEDLYIQTREDWKYVAMVIDRLQLYIFFIVTTAGTVGILMDAPHIFEYVDQDRIIEIYRGK